MVSMVSRFREHGLQVTASTHIDSDEPLVTGKVIMALGSEDDVANEARVAEQDPDQYLVGEESDLVIRSGEVYTWLLRIGDTVAHEHESAGDHQSAECNRHFGYFEGLVNRPGLGVWDKYIISEKRRVNKPKSASNSAKKLK